MKLKHMESLGSQIELKIPQATTTFKTRRDELVDSYVQAINKLRASTRFKPITASEVALRLRMNPALKYDRQDGEVELLLKECLQKGDFKKFFWTCPMNKKLSPGSPPRYKQK